MLFPEIKQERVLRKHATFCSGLAIQVSSNRSDLPPQTPRHLRFLKNFGQIPRYVASLDGQMPHPLELQKSFKEVQIVNSNVHIL